MAKLLDRSREDEIARTIVDALDESGYEPQEAIPGLIQAVHQQADFFERLREQALDEAADLLADA